MRAERVLGILLAARHQVEIVAHADDLDRAVEHLAEILHHGRGELDGPLLARHVGRIGIADQPVFAAIDPGVHAVMRG